MNEDIQKGYLVHLFLHGKTYVRVPGVNEIKE